MSGTRATLRNTGSLAKSSGSFGYSGGRPRGANAEDEDEILVPGVTRAPGVKPPAKTDPKLWVGGFGSYHSGGGQFLFGDGSVHFLSYGISPATLQQMANRTDEKLLTDREF